MNALDESITNLAADLLAAGVILKVDARNRLRVTAPLGAITDELDSRIKSVKSELACFVRLSLCDRCGSTKFRDYSIHDGHSIRRDCAQCGRTAGFPVWNPQG